MHRKRLCVFDLDGTFYPKESKITYNIRERVIRLAAYKNGISIDEAEKIYFELPKEFANPYAGLKSIKIQPAEYKEIFNSICVEEYIEEDAQLSEFLGELACYADIYVVSLASEKYVRKALLCLGVDSIVKDVLCVNEESEYAKYLIFKRLAECIDYDEFVSIGDDEKNDLQPAAQLGYETHMVDFSDDKTNIYSIIKQIIKAYKSSVPGIMRVENITYCNERCIICPYESVQRKKGVMDKKLFEKIICEHSRVADKPKLIFPASIGEPFLEDDFTERVKMASYYYSDIAAFSNASLLDIKKVKEYINNGGTELMLTLHGYTKECHEMITNSKLYDSVRRNIDSIVYVNQEMGYPIKIYLDIYADDNVNCDEYIDEKRSQGVIAQKIPLCLTHNWGGRVTAHSKRNKRKTCSRIYEQFGVQYDGTVVPCCIDVEAEYILGNAANEKLADIFRHEPYMKLAELERSGNLVNNKLCRQCNI